jgi:hypothetical protein
MSTFKFGPNRHGSVRIVKRDSPRRREGRQVRDRSASKAHLPVALPSPSGGLSSFTVLRIPPFCALRALRGEIRWDSILCRRMLTSSASRPPADSLRLLVRVLRAFHGSRFRPVLVSGPVRGCAVPVSASLARPLMFLCEHTSLPKGGRFLPAPVRAGRCQADGFQEPDLEWWIVAITR